MDVATAVGYSVDDAHIGSLPFPIATGKPTMRKRTGKLVGLAIVLAGGVATFAQQEKVEVVKDQAKPHIPYMETLRKKIINLRAEVELLQLEHDADRSTLLDALKAVGQAEIMSGMFQPGSTLVGAAENDNLPTLKIVTDRKALEAMQAYIDRKKKAFLQQAMELNEKKIGLEYIEKRYSKAD
jgi:hypothetical protein